MISPDQEISPKIGKNRSMSSLICEHGCSTATTAWLHRSGGLDCEVSTARLRRLA